MFRVNGARILLTCFLAMTVTVAGAMAGGDPSGATPAEVVKCGEPIGKSPEVPLAHALKFPEKYIGKTVIVTGFAAEVCQKKGCWMQVVPGEEGDGVRVTFKDYGFFVPKDAAGMRVRAEGVFELKVLDKDHADHLVAEGASLTLNPDGTANELGFVATGVELRAAKKKAES